MESNDDKYVGMPAIEAKLRRLADAALHAADAYRDDPIRIKCKKLGIKQFVSDPFYYDELNALNEAMLKVDNVVRGWEVEPVESPEILQKLNGRKPRTAKRRRGKKHNKDVKNKGNENEQA